MPTLNRKRVLALVATVLIPILSACNTWERTTFQTLSASKATIDAAQAQYEAKAIVQNGCTYSVINDGKAAQTAAVDAMVTYEQFKTTKGDLAAQEAIVTADLVKLVPLVAQVQALISNPSAPCIGGGK